MSKKFNIHEWVLSVKYWSLLFIPHVSICLIFLLYLLIGTSIIQEIESNKIESSSSIKDFQEERERLLIKLIEKREIYDLQQYTKFVYKHIRQYEEEIKKQIISEENLPLNFSNSLFFISTTLTTVGSNEFLPKTNLGKLFLIIYIGFGIPLTLVFLTDLSYLIKQLIETILLKCFSIYSSKYFLHIRRFLFFHLIEEEDEDLDSSNIKNHVTIIKLIFTMFIYILIGSCFISSKSFFESFYLCFTSIFTIHLNRNIYRENNLFFITIYLFFGLAIVLLYIKAIKKKVDEFLKDIENKLLQNLVKWTQQIGFRNLNTDDLLANTDINLTPTSESAFFQHRHIPRTKSLEQSTTLRPIGIAEPLRRLSTGFIRAFTINDAENQTLDKSVQVSTIIRRCGRCSEINLPIRPIREHDVLSTSTPSTTDYSSSCEEEDDVMDFPPPNLERMRQRRATLVAKTIINQMATQPRSGSIDELMPPFKFPTHQRCRSGDSSPPIAVRCSVKVSTPTPPDLSPKRRDSQAEFLEISKQISALLTPSDDENEGS